MKEDFNERIVQKIKEQLQNHEEDYRDGAWENFLAKKKEKNQRVLFWYVKGVAASIVIIIAVGLLFIERHPDVNDSYIITEEKPAIPGDSLPKEGLITLNPIHNEDKKSVIGNTELNNQNNVISKIIDSEDKSGNKEHTKDTFVITDKTFKAQNPSQDKKNVTKQKLLVEDHKETDVAIASLKNKKVLTSDEEVVNIKKTNAYDQEKAISWQNNAIIEPKIMLSKDSKIVLPITTKQDLFNNDPDILIQHSQEKEKQSESNNNKIEIGLLLSPSYGSGTDNNSSIASSGLGAGLAVNIPINNSNVSFSTGAVFNALNVTNDRTIRTGEFSGANETIDHNETSLYGVDIPLNVMYRPSNSKVYVQTGISSYITFKETVDLSSTFVREVEVFHFNNGVVETYTTTESVTTKETSKNEEIRFHPLGTVNISFGYRATLTNKLIYEIQPFYKYPLNALTSQGDKMHTAGLTLKVIFSK